MLIIFEFGWGDKHRESTSLTQSHNNVAEADKQRKSVIEHVRSASYLLYADTPDPEVLKDKGFLGLAKTDFPMIGTAFGVNNTGLVFTAAHEITDTGHCTAKGTAEAREREAGHKATYCILITQTYNKAYRGRVIYVDEANDVAVIQIEGTHDDLPFLEFTGNENIEQGEEVLTVGAPLGNANFMTIGFISNPQYEDEDTQGRKDVQFLAIIQPGNSGGPLVSVATGKTVGLVQRIFALMVPSVNGNAMPISTGMSYAIHVNILKQIYAKIIAQHSK